MDHFPRSQDATFPNARLGSESLDNKKTMNSNGSSTGIPLIALRKPMVFSPSSHTGRYSLSEPQNHSLHPQILPQSQSNQNLDCHYDHPQNL